MTDPQFTIENLRALMSTSPAYRGLPQDQKDNIETYIRQNNKPVLLYVYQQLREEAGAHQLARENLAKKVLNIKPSAQNELRENLKKDFAPGPKLPDTPPNPLNKL